MSQVSDSLPPADEPLSEAQLDRLLAEHWPHIAARVSARVGRQVVWNRRLQEASRFVLAASVLLALQMAWGALTLQSLHRRAAQARRHVTNSIAAPVEADGSIFPEARPG